MAIDKKALMEELQRVKSGSGKIRFLKKDMTTVLRVAEFNDGLFHRRIVYHARKGDFSSKPAICRKAVFGEDCAFCMLMDKMQQSGEEVVFTSRSRYLLCAYDINSGGVPKFGAWEVPITVFEHIGALLLSDDWADILDPKTGHALCITKQGSGLDTTYSVGPSRNPVPIGKESIGSLEDPLESVEDPTFEGQCKLLGIDPKELLGHKVEKCEKEEEDPWVKDDQETKKNVELPVCFGDLNFFDPKENECRVCQNLKACGEKVMCGGSTTKKESNQSNELLNSQTKKPNQSSSENNPTGESAQDILAKIMGKKR